MKLTKEYIKECDCKEIQNLSPISTGDWIMFRGGYIPVLFSGDYNINYNKRGIIIWLPTGDQLDDEIIKIIPNDGYYRVYQDKTEDHPCHVEFIPSWKHDMGRKKINGKNLLMAKIKLLKALQKDTNV